MEVHHHPQLTHRPKPWKEYLLEYLMIFLAVVTGFFAESLREHNSERSKEKEYLTSMFAELRVDTARYHAQLNRINAPFLEEAMLANRIDSSGSWLRTKPSRKQIRSF